MLDPWPRRRWREWDFQVGIPLHVAVTTITSENVFESQEPFFYNRLTFWIIRSFVPAQQPRGSHH